MIAASRPSHSPTPGGLAARWVLLVLAGVLMLGVVSVVGARHWLYFGPDPAPADSLGEYRRFALTLNGLDEDGKGNGWAAAVEAFKIIETARLEFDDAEAASLRAMLTEVGGLGETDDALGAMPNLVQTARNRGLDSALDELCGARAAVASTPSGGVEDWVDPIEVLRTLSRVNRWRLQLALSREDREGAFRYAVTQFALIRVMIQQPITYGQIDAMMSLQEDGKRLMQAVADGAFDLDELLLLLDDLSSIHPPALTQVLRGDRLAAYAVTQAIMPGGIRPKPASRAFNNAALAAHFDLADQFASLSSEQRRAEDTWDELSPYQPDRGPHSIMVALLAMNPTRLSECSDLLHTQLAGLRGVIAVEAYVRTHGEYPADFADLVPEFLEAVPSDPRGPDRIRYVVTHDAVGGGARPYLLYATGAGGVDNGGKSDPEPSLWKVYRSPGGLESDYVFNQPRGGASGE